MYESSRDRRLHGTAAAVLFVLSGVVMSLTPGGGFLLFGGGMAFLSLALTRD